MKNLAGCLWTWLDFHTSLEDLFVKYNEDFKTVKFDEILDEMGVRKAELEKLKE